MRESIQTKKQKKVRDVNERETGLSYENSSTVFAVVRRASFPARFESYFHESGGL